MFLFYDWPFQHFAKNVAYVIFPFNSWLSFSDCRLLWGFLPARRYASVGTSYDPVFVSASVCHSRCSIEMNRRIELVFDT